MNSVKDRLPLPNYMCRVLPKNPRYERVDIPFRYVEYSDKSGYFWDNLVDDILQSYEVTHWEYWEDS